VKTCRDTWCYNFSETSVSREYAERMIGFYHEQVEGVSQSISAGKLKAELPDAGREIH
jgi:predicted helicase